MQLNQYVEWSWWVIFAPLFMAEILFTILQLPGASYNTYLQRQDASDPFFRFYCHLYYPGFLLRSFYKEIFIFAFTFLFAFNLAYAGDLGDGAVNGFFSWWYVTIPLFLLVFVAMGLSIVENCCSKKLKREDYVPLEDAEAEMVNTEPSLLAQIGYICCSCICVSFFAVFFILMSGWLDADISVSAMGMMSPVILAACLLCCVCICCAFPLYAYGVRQYSKEDDFELPVPPTEEPK